MNLKQRFRAVIEDAGDGGAYVTVPFDVEQIFGKKRVKVKASIEGVSYRGSLVRMGTPCHLLPILKEIRKVTGKSIGDEVQIELEEDLEPRQVDLPQDFRDALEAYPDAFAFFLRLSYTHQKEYVRWVEEARRIQTRQVRIARALDLLRQGKRVH